MNKNNSTNLNALEGEEGSILVVTDFVAEGCWERGMVMSVPEIELFAEEAERCGFNREQFIFVNPSPPVPEDAQASDTKTKEFIADYREEMNDMLWEYFMRDNPPRCVLTLGKWGARQFFGKPVTLRNVRGTLTEHNWNDISFPVLPLLSPKEVLRFPERREVYNTDFLQLQSLQGHGWDVSVFREAAQGAGYEWCLDLTELLENPPTCLGLDCETVGNDVHSDEFRLLTVAFTPNKGKSLVVPLDLEWWNDATLFSDASADAPRLSRRLRSRLIGQIRRLLADPDVHCVGHNLKYDIHALEWANIEVANWYADTMQLAFVVDENMQNKGLDDCVRRWLPQFAGYADEFNEKVDKSKMQFVEHGDFLEYAGGDTDVTYRLTNVLLKEAKKDERQWETFVKVQMPALRSFVNMERQGVCVDTTELGNLQTVLAARERELYQEIMEDAPPALLREFEGNWKLTPNFVAAMLFGENGVKVDNDTGEVDMENGQALVPCVFTATTKEPSTSAKDHLPYFEHVQLVRRIIEYKEIQTLRSRYVGDDDHTVEESVARLKNGTLPKFVRDAAEKAEIEIPPKKAVRVRRPDEALTEYCREFARSLGQSDDEIALLSPSELECQFPFAKGQVKFDPFGNVSKLIHEPATGFWKYLKNRESGQPRIHPSFFLHRTVTGRTASADPNAQNFPKRGPLAKAYRKIFIPTPGYVFIESDLSQAELRIAAWMANETEMIRIYNEGGDIHSATAATVMGVSDAKFMAGLHDETPLVDVVNSWPGANEFLREYPRDERESLTVQKFCKATRQKAKGVNFGFLYGMGWRKFMVFARTDYKVIFTEDEAKAAREAFFRRYPRLAVWHQQMRRFVDSNGYVRSLHGALRRLPNIESDDEGIQGMSSRQAINSPVQRFASDLGIIALSRFVRDANPELMRPVLFIHDANIIEAREDVVEEAASALKHYMETPPLEHWFGLTPPLPIAADVSVGYNLGEMNEDDWADCEAVAPSWYRSGEEPPSMDPAVAEVWRKKKRRSIILTDA